MIGYHSDTQTFYLGGANSSYVLRVDGAGYLRRLHFGGKIGEDDLSFLDLTPWLVSFSPIPPDAPEENFSLDLIGNEIGSYGQGDFRTPSILIERADGGRASRFRYVRHTVSDGAPLPGLPHVRGGETLSIELKDALSDTAVTLHYTVFEECDVVARWTEVRNCGTAPITLRRAYSFCLDLPEGNYRALRLHGRHMMERIPEVTPLGHGSLRIGSGRGASSHQMNPFLALLGENCGEETGECYGFEAVYSGSFCLEAEQSQTGQVRVCGGINDLNFSWELAPGERFYTPQVLIGWSGGGLGGLSRAFSDCLRGHLLPPDRVFSLRPIVINNWEATYFDFDREKLCALADIASTLGVDTFVLDDGWFGRREDDRSGLGDWFVNETKLRGGLDPVIDFCKSRGLRFGLWFEPEMVSEDSDLYRAHPDWAVGRADTPRCTSRNQLVLDFTRADVREEIFARMSNLLSRHAVKYVKWDMNRHITEFFSAQLPPARQGEFQHRYLLGVYELAERLQRAFPDVFFEGCSGGGGRFDAGMLAYFPQIWTSDDTDAYERAKIQWGTSYGYPLSTMSCHVSLCPNHQTGRVIAMESRGAIASLGATGYELDLSKLGKEELEEIRLQIARFREVEDLILKGDLFRIANPFEGNEFCMNVVSKDRTRAYVVGMRAHATAGDYDRRIRLAGLAEEMKYRVEELGIVARGDTLMRAGLLMPRGGDFSTWTWHLTKVEE